MVIKETVANELKSDSCKYTLSISFQIKKKKIQKIYMKIDVADIKNIKHKCSNVQLMIYLLPIIDSASN